ncbi:delta-sarcoglycan [Ixodes scapularis]|uniref:delta-sarcoglycan n=1 Tax=Ixodes scapularis TaxID=6945 RepID=UPI00116188D2|nr:delta-sarcoglycan [Ixodes scapularis]
MAAAPSASLAPPSVPLAASLSRRPSAWEGPRRASAWEQRRSSVFVDAVAAEDLVACRDTDVTPVSPGQRHHVGIYGWRKRCLYLLVILLLAMVVMNVALTVWVLRVLDFSLDGMGRLRIVEGGVQINGDADILQALHATHVQSRRDDPLKIESPRNITMNARSKEGRITNRLFVGNSIVEAFAEEFLVRNTEGKLLFRAADGEVAVAADTLRVTGPGGVRFDGSVQTPLVRAETFQQLMLESPTRRLVVQGPQGVLVESRAGDIGISCHRNLTLKSKEGEVQLDSDRIVFPNLRTALPASSGSPYQNVYQVCVCQSGTLFLSRAEGQCQADEYVCK